MICTALVALAVPDFGLVGAFIGAFGSTTLSYILPVWVHLAMFRSTYGWPRTLLSYMILAFGAAVMVTGVALSVRDMIEEVPECPMESGA